MRCPSCGGDVTAEKTFAHLAVCQYCRSAVIVDEEVARIAGKMAVLAQTSGPLFTGATGSLKGRKFRVAGRVRYGYAEGYWDEWYIIWEGSEESAWISEDGYTFTLESISELDPGSIQYESVTPGDRIEFGDSVLLVDEKDIAECEGAEGALPFPVVQGEKTPFIELSSNSLFATLEFMKSGDVRLFAGERLEISDLSMDASAEEAGAVDTLEAERKDECGNLQRVIRRDDRAMDLACYSCGASLDLPAEGVDHISCPSCGSDFDLSLKRIECPSCHVAIPVKGGENTGSLVCLHCNGQVSLRGNKPSLLKKIVRDKRPDVPFQLGQKCTFEGVDFLLIGYMRTLQVDEWGRYITDEFMLFNEKVGYRWLTMEDGHFSLGGELEERPESLDPKYLYPRDTFKYLGRKWTVFEKCSSGSEVLWVDGELPWVAKVGSRSSFMDSVSPPYMLTCEWTLKEMEWHCARYLDRKEVAEAFGVSVDSLPISYSVAANQPFTNSRFRKQALPVMLVFLILFLVSAAVAFVHSGQQVMKNYIVKPNVLASGTISPPMNFDRPTVCVGKFKAPVDNSWMYLEVDLLNEAGDVVLPMSAQISYYHGYEGGESWSEGSTKDSTLFKINDPGIYRLRIAGQAGTGSKPGSASDAKPLTISVSKDVLPVRYFLGGIFVCGIFAVLELVLRHSFERRRWGEEDD